MKEIKIAKKIPFLLNIKANKNEQIFEFNTTNKKYLHYAYDQRYCLKRKIERAINQYLQSYLVKERIEDSNKIIIVYEKEITFSPVIVNCEFYLPPYNGCLYCTKCKKENDFLYCEEKKKHYSLTGIKSCPIFQSIEELI